MREVFKPKPVFVSNHMVIQICADLRRICFVWTETVEFWVSTGEFKKQAKLVHNL